MASILFTRPGHRLMIGQYGSGGKSALFRLERSSISEDYVVKDPVSFVSAVSIDGEARISTGTKSLSVAKESGGKKFRVSIQNFSSKVVIVVRLEKHEWLEIIRVLAN